MATIPTVTRKAGDVVKQFTVNIRVSGMAELRLRTWFAVRLLRFACWVAGRPCKIERVA